MGESSRTNQCAGLDHLAEDIQLDKRLSLARGISGARVWWVDDWSAAQLARKTDGRRAPFATLYNVANRLGIANRESRFALPLTASLASRIRYSHQHAALIRKSQIALATRQCHTRHERKVI
jgi:hypothetical protein